MANVRSINENVITPVSEIEPVVVVVPVSNRPIARLTIPIVDDEVVLMDGDGGAEQNLAAKVCSAATGTDFDTTAPPPTPAVRSGSGGFRGVFHGNPSADVDDDYMTTDFLKRCFTCRKMMENMVEIFFYKDMSFCSDDCRAKEMVKDVEEKLKNREKMKKNRRSRKNPPSKGDDGKVIFFIGDN